MLFVLALCLFSWIFVRNAWVVDDAYTTSRLPSPSRTGSQTPPPI
jgi:hypothetical protein